MIVRRGHESIIGGISERDSFLPPFLAVILALLLSISQAQTAGTGAISGTITGSEWCGGRECHDQGD